MPTSTMTTAVYVADGNTLANQPLVSVIIACRNEERFISRCLESIFASDYSQDRLEVLVIDGCSTDGTRAVVEAWSIKHPSIRLFTNPQKITPVAFNIGVDHAKGDLIMIMSAHATYDPAAIGNCVRHSFGYNADNVGGIWKIEARESGLIADTIVVALSHPFGVGGGLYRTTKGHDFRWVDTAAFGCYRREVFRRIGKYNEQLLRNQDLELNLRLKMSGGATLLAPDVVIHYSARTDIRTFCKHSFQDGLWVILSFAYSEIMPVSWRHLVPLAFVSSMIMFGAAAMAIKPAAYAFVAIAGLYACTNLVYSLTTAIRQRKIGLLFVLPAIFTLLHLSYGFGSLWGCVKLIFTGNWKKFCSLMWAHRLSPKRFSAASPLVK